MILDELLEVTVTVPGCWCGHDDSSHPAAAEGLSWCSECGCSFFRKRGDDPVVTAHVADETRFWAKVNRHGPEPDYRPDLGPCWRWTGAISVGYGSFWHGGRTRGAHRYSYELLVGPIPAGMSLDHLCRVPSCVNPSHLEAVTHAENMRRGIGFSGVNVAKTHCPRGHEYTPENTYHRPDAPWTRGCHQCLAARKRSIPSWRRRTALTPQERVTVCDLRRDGVTVAALAERFGIPESTVRMILRKQAEARQLKWWAYG